MPIKSKSTDENKHTFCPGDNVIVADGELVNLQGKVMSVEGDKITMMPSHDDLKVQIGLPVLFTTASPTCYLSLCLTDTEGNTQSASCYSCHF